jgi:hypothetical protein
MEHNKRIGIRAVQSALKRATQSNLSMFHMAGVSSNESILPCMSIQDLLDGRETLSCYMSAKLLEDKTILPKLLVGKRFSDFLLSISNSRSCHEHGKTDEHILLARDDPENIFYDYLGQDRPEVFTRFYLDPRLFSPLGYTLKEISKIVFPNEACYVSPDFMGIIDVVAPKEYTCVEDIDIPLYGSSRIKHSFIDEGHVFTIGSDIERMMSLKDVVDIRTIVSNDVRDVEKIFGVKAARNLLIKLVDDTRYPNVISDFMVRSGRVLSLKKSNTEMYNRGFISEISFEKCRDTIINNLSKSDNFSVIDPLESVYSRIWAYKRIS